MRRVLFVTYYFPPSGGPGVQRSLKFTKYLPEFGWMPTVLTVKPEDASYPDLDPDLGLEIPTGVEVSRTAAWDPYAMYARVLGREKQDVVTVGFLGEARTNARQRVARWIRANVFLPDARVGWVPFAVSRGRQLLRRYNHEAIVTTGPPHSSHLIGLILSSLHKKPWIVDLRDPWTGIDYSEDLPTSAPAHSLDAAMERTVLRRASAVTIISEAMRSQVIEGRRLPIEVIENGFDPADFEGLQVSPRPDRFTLAHIGNLSAARNPTSLWKALRSMRASQTVPDLSLVLIGNVEPEVLAAAEANGVSVDVLPYVPHETAVQRMCESTMLLLSINRVKSAPGIVTGKLYEYVASGRPVLGIGPPDGDAARILRDSGAGHMFAFDDSAGIGRYLQSAYHAWKSGRRLQGASEAAASLFSRRSQTKRLATLLDRISGGRLEDRGSRMEDRR